MKEKTILPRVIGYLASLLLTLSTFALIGLPDLLRLDNQKITYLILVFAVLQCGVQSIFFLNLWSEKKPRWNLFVFGSTISIILIIILFSIWIMDHLNYNMMPR